MTVTRLSLTPRAKSATSLRAPSFDHALLRAWLVVLAGTAVVTVSAIAGTFDSADGLAVALTVAAVIAGASLLFIGTRMIDARASSLPNEDFARSRRPRRVAVTFMHAPALLAILPLFLLHAPWNAVGYVGLFLCGPIILASLLMPYQVWASGPTSSLDEYHLRRRHLARSRAYTGLVAFTLAAFAACAATRWLPPPSWMAMIAFSYLWLIVSLPCCVLAWTEPDIDNG